LGLLILGPARGPRTQQILFDHFSSCPSGISSYYGPCWGRFLSHLSVLSLSFVPFETLLLSPPGQSGNSGMRPCFGYSFLFSPGGISHPRQPPCELGPFGKLIDLPTRGHHTVLALPPRCSLPSGFLEEFYRAAISSLFSCAAPLSIGLGPGGPRTLINTEPYPSVSTRVASPKNRTPPPPPFPPLHNWPPVPLGPSHGISPGISFLLSFPSPPVPPVPPLFGVPALVPF